MEGKASIKGILLMLDDATPHVAVPVQAIRDGEVMATTLSDGRGRYRLIDLEPGQYQVRCQVLGGYVYYGGEKGGTAPDRAIGLQIEQGVTSNVAWDILGRAAQTGGRGSGAMVSKCHAWFRCVCGIRPDIYTGLGRSDRGVGL